MKRLEVTEKVIGENTFYIKPFPAFTSANISGELSAALLPVLGSLVPMLGGASVGADGSVDVMNMDLELAAPALTSAFTSLSGDKVESLMRKLLIDNKNVSVEGEATEGRVQILNYDLANEVFCGELQDMFILCVEVIKINFGGFFKKLGVQFGNLHTTTQEETPSTEDTETLI